MHDKFLKKNTLNILDTIIARKKSEILEAKNSISYHKLEKSILFDSKNISLKDKFITNNSFGIIAEHKRKSPSKGIINDSFSVEYVTQGYQNAGAYALSILTDTDFFGGSPQDLLLARKATQIPILRKDFIIDEYQILEAKAWGADVILLIAANLEPKVLAHLAKFAASLSLEVLMEVHDKSELLHNLHPNIDFIGVNNRNLKTFDVSIDTSLQLADIIPNDFIKIAESGLTSATEISILQKAGFKGFLIGESFMKTDNPGLACKKLIDEIDVLSNKK